MPRMPIADPTAIHRGATSADVAFIAQEKAMEYERRRAAGELDEEE